VVEGSLAADVVVVGNVAWNERDQVLLQSRTTGFVEKLYVRATLDRVAAGAPLADIYVPAWVAAQEEYLALTRMRGPDLAALRDAARQRMRLVGMNDEQIAQVVERGSVQSRFALLAPIGGVVTELMLREGATVQTGMTLARIQGTGTVWAEGQVPESQAALLRPGAAVTATSPAAPGQTFRGRVQALLPDVDPATRTLKARLELANPGGRLVPGMFVQMRFAAPPARATLLVPSDAVIHTGRRSVVMVAEEEGRFRPVQVTPGLEGGGQTEILQGLQAGQRVVLSGQFLIDSEASLRGLEARLNPPETPRAASHATSARVEALDGDTVTLNHPPIASLKWPQMEMDFRLPPRKDRPRDLAAGDAVEVEFNMQDGDVPQITSIRRVAPSLAPTTPASAAMGASR
jgi:membrane fusion protein, copper/silver efflux system